MLTRELLKLIAVLSFLLGLSLTIPTHASSTLYRSSLAEHLTALFASASR